MARTKQSARMSSGPPPKLARMAKRNRETIDLTRMWMYIMVRLVDVENSLSMTTDPQLILESFQDLDSDDVDMLFGYEDVMDECHIVVGRQVRDNENDRHDVYILIGFRVNTDEFVPYNSQILAETLTNHLISQDGVDIIPSELLIMYEEEKHDEFALWNISIVKDMNHWVEYGTALVT